MADPYDNWMILMWPLITLLTWTVIATGLVRLLTDRSWERRADLPSPETSLFRKPTCGETGDDDHWRRGAKDPPHRLPKPCCSPRVPSAIDPADRPRTRSPQAGDDSVQERSPGSTGRTSISGRHLRLPLVGRRWKSARTRSLTRAIRCGPGSVRGQITLLTTAVAVLTLLTLLVAGAGMYSMDHARTAQGQEAPQRAVPAANETGSGTAPGRLRSRAADLGRTRTVARGHHPAASPAAALGPLPGQASRWSLRHREPRLPASGSSGSATSPVRAAGPRAAGFPSPDSRHLILVIEAVALISLATYATWKVTGRVLRPVDVVRSELAVIGFGDLHTRISEPANAREVARLCRTINNALQRLDEGKEELQELERSHRRFASDVSHELRTPIAGLRAQLEEAQQDLGGVRLPDLVESMLGQVERLQEITDDLLFLARVGTGAAAEQQHLDLAALVRAEVSRRSDQRPVQLHLASGSIVNAVPIQIGRLLANLLDNAQRHCTHQVCVDVHAVHAVVELAVSDDGPGIALGDRERVFHRLTRLDDARRLDHNGTGLGLAIARDIAHAHHGTLNVEESTTGGACFVLRLPRVPSVNGGPS